jgi:hypothetical protein
LTAAIVQALIRAARAHRRAVSCSLFHAAHTGLRNIADRD